VRPDPLIVTVPPVVVAMGVFPLTYVVATPAEADEQLRKVAATIHGIGERWILDVGALYRALQMWKATEALLEARLELERREAGTPEALHGLYRSSMPDSPPLWPEEVAS
jgi:hypothetical protein